MYNACSFTRDAYDLFILLLRGRQRDWNGAGYPEDDVLAGSGGGCKKGTRTANCSRGNCYVETTKGGVATSKTPRTAWSMRRKWLLHESSRIVYVSGLCRWPRLSLALFRFVSLSLIGWRSMLAFVSPTNLIFFSLVTAFTRKPGNNWWIYESVKDS